MKLLTLPQETGLRQRSGMWKLIISREYSSASGAPRDVVPSPLSALPRLFFLEDSLCCETRSVLQRSMRWVTKG